MKLRNINALLSAALLMSGLSASAVVAKKGVMNVPQPDGTELRVEIKGDENHHFYTTDDGYLLVQDQADNSGALYYGRMSALTGKIESTGIKARNSELRPATDRAVLQTIDKAEAVKAFRSELRSAGVKTRRMGVLPSLAGPLKAQARVTGNVPEEGYTPGPGLFPGTGFPSAGVQKGLVILVQYTDVSFNVSNPHDYFTRWLNEVGFADNGATGSARDWFISNSSGIFQPDFDLYGPITLSKSMSYYGGNDYWGNDKNPEWMAIEACQQLDATVDFSEYDRDGDGYIDNVYIIYAGRGEATGGGSSTVWPHSWQVTEAQSTVYKFDGVQLDKYACSNEWEGTASSGKPDGIGTFCHEFSHVMGLPDLYDTAYSGNCFTPDSWSALDYGPYNNDGRTPPSYSAFERYALGWLDPIQINGQMNGRLQHIETTNDAYIVKTSKDTEYFLFENRQQSGWDTYIPGHGMLVWHIDYNESVWSNNKPNNTSSHQYVDIEEADNTRTDATRAGDAFPGTSNVTSFTDTTSPSMKTWSNVSLGLPITDIAENDGVITFKVLGGVNDIPATVIDPNPSELTSKSFTASWQAVEGATNYIVTLTDPQGEAVGAYRSLKVGAVTSYTFEGLEPLTSYSLTVVVESSGSFSDASEAVVFTTAAPSFADLRPVLLEAADITHDGFTASWEPMENAVDYRLSVYRKYIDNYASDVCDFTNGLSALPAGWSTNSSSTYGNAAYSGQATPAVKLSTDAGYVQSALYTDDIASVSFWHRGATSATSNSISLMGLVNDVWTELARYDIINTTGGAVYTLDEVPPMTRRVKVVFNKVGSGYLSVDDVTVYHGGDVNIIPAEGYTDLNVGAECSWQVTGLEAETEYFFNVQASDGELLSLRSEERSLTTGVAPEPEPVEDPIDLNEADYSNDFTADDEETARWHSTDVDADGLCWHIDPAIADGIVSLSYDGSAPVMADDWLISPPITVPDDNALMSWKVKVVNCAPATETEESGEEEAPDAESISEHYTVMMSPSGGKEIADFTEILYDLTITDDTPAWHAAYATLPAGNIRVAFVHNASTSRHALALSSLVMESGRIPGDLNADGVVDAVDIAHMVDYILDIDHAGVNIAVADLNGDYVVNSTDVALIILLMLD